MIYIPVEWLEDKGNLDRVHEIIDSEFYSDINLIERIGMMVEQLRDIGEHHIADKLQKGEIVLPS